MTEQPQKQGMPRGCVIGLIVASALLLLVIALFVVCRIYQDDLIKFSINNTLGGMRKVLAVDHVSGIQTASVDSIAADFSSRFDTTIIIDYDRLQPLVIAIQTATTNGGKFDSTTVMNIVNGMVGYYPELRRFLTKDAESDTATAVNVANDTTAIAKPSADSAASPR